MKSQVIELQVENKSMNEMNTMTSKTNHYQELIKTMDKEKDMKQILVTNFRYSDGTEQTRRKKQRS